MNLLLMFGVKSCPLISTAAPPAPCKVRPLCCPCAEELVLLLDWKQVTASELGSLSRPCESRISQTRVSRGKHHKTFPSLSLGNASLAEFQHMCLHFSPHAGISHFSVCQETDPGGVWIDKEQSKNIHAGWRERRMHFQT